MKDQQVQPGDLIVSNKLSNPPPPPAPTALLTQSEIRPSIPLRLISLDGRSAYSSGSQGLLPFEFSTGPIDIIRADIVIEPKLSYLDPKDPQAASQFIRGLYPDGWTAQEASVVLKVPPAATTLEAKIWKAPNAPASQVTLSINGHPLTAQDLPTPGIYTISSPVQATTTSATVTLSVDKVFHAKGDARNLGIVITGIGFK
jgi:hypothetical protein